MRKLIANVAFVLIIPASAVAADLSPQQDEITIAAVGDLMLGNRIEPFLKEFGPDYPFADVKPFLGKADAVVGNLECSISSRGIAVKNKRFTLRAGTIAAQALAAAGFRVVGNPREQPYYGLRSAGPSGHAVNFR